MIHTIRFSGGRTSAFLVYEIERLRNLGVFDKEDEFVYIFLDTGAEHPATYEFIKKVANDTKINLICLKAIIDPIKGNGVSYKQIDIDEIGVDMSIWESMVSKYGTPYIGGAFCTDRLKLTPVKKYCKDNYGAEENFDSWLGIRIDEPKRIRKHPGIFYLADISDFEKQDIVDWWKKMPFDLTIDEHLGNCVFCIKKGAVKLALAERDEPKLAEQWINSIRDNAKEGSIITNMYRNNNSLENIIATFRSHSTEDLRTRVKNTKGFASGGCSESCEAIPD